LEREFKDPKDIGLVLLNLYHCRVITDQAFEKNLDELLAQN